MTVGLLKRENETDDKYLAVKTNKRSFSVIRPGNGPRDYEDDEHVESMQWERKDVPGPRDRG
ncbi:MAG TPA: hypothetical protein VFQ68_16400 [Streptosporangiaceae bacterium]|nr:hypothetical protein [Streptosporangiaceae bacterium]